MVGEVLVLKENPVPVSPMVPFLASREVTVGIYDVVVPEDVPLPALETVLRNLKSGSPVSTLPRLL